jgi:hypothetical protein
VGLADREKHSLEFHGAIPENEPTKFHHSKFHRGRTKLHRTKFHRERSRVGRSDLRMARTWDYPRVYHFRHGACKGALGCARKYVGAKWTTREIP